MTEKYCTGCDLLKPLEDFHKQSKGLGGRCSKCKACVKEYDAARHAGNRDAVNERIRLARQPGGSQYESYLARVKRNNEQKTPYDIRNGNLRRYNLTTESYNQLLESQDFKCAICKRHYTEFTRSLHVDHDHSCCPAGKSCGKCIRGLLCHGCNASLGAVSDSIKVLEAMIEYLKLNCK